MGFGYFKACHQDLPRPSSGTQPRGASCKLAAPVWAPHLGQSLPRAAHTARLTVAFTRVDAGRSGQQGCGGSPHHLLSLAKVVVSLLETLSVAAAAFTATPADSFFSRSLKSSCRQGSLLPQEWSSRFILFTSLSERCFTSLAENTFRQARCT